MILNKRRGQAFIAIIKENKTYPVRGSVGYKSTASGSKYQSFAVRLQEDNLD